LDNTLKRLSENEVLPLSDSDRWFFRMAQYIEGDDRNQSMLLPAAIDDYVSPASPVRAIDAFVDQLDLAASGFKIRTYYNSSACKACPARAQCTKSTIRKLIIRVHQETMDRARERLTAVPDAMRQRAALVEHPFGTIKDRHGYGGLLCRGLSLAGAEMGLSA
jgi:hypothetical protein